MDRTDEILRKLEAIDARIGDTRERLIKIEAAVERLPEELRALAADLDALEDRVDRIETAAAEQRGMSRSAMGGLAAGGGAAAAGLIELLRGLVAS